MCALVLHLLCLLISLLEFDLNNTASAKSDTFTCTTTLKFYKHIQ